MPRPASSSGPVTIAGPAPWSSSTSSSTIPRRSRAKPIRTTRRGEAWGNSLGTPTAAASSVTDSGSSRTPVATADSPSATERKRGTTKNSPACSRNWKEKDVSPACNVGLRSMAGSTSAAPLPLDLDALPEKEQRQDAGTAEDEPEDRRGPEPDRCVGLRLHEAPRAGADHAVHHQGEAGGGEDRADRVEAHAGDRGRVGHPCRESQDAEHDDDLGDEHHPPAQVRGAQPADQRADGHRDGTGRRHQPVGPGTIGAAEVRRHEGHDRGHDQRGAQPLENRPADDEDGKGLRQRRRERTAPVDHAADHEGTLAAEDLAELAARDHEGGHDQRVERDGQLDPGDRGADVLGHRGDGDVHDRAVEGHEELRRGQGEKDQPVAGGGRLAVGHDGHCYPGADETAPVWRP